MAEFYQRNTGGGRATAPHPNHEVGKRGRQTRPETRRLSQGACHALKSNRCSVYQKCVAWILAICMKAICILLR
jgi:hypothetical protein